MQVMKVNGINYAPSFNRRLKDNEKKEYRVDTIQEAYDYLGIKDVGMILHGSCYPAGKYDFGVGSPFGKSSEKLAELEVLHGFTSAQQGPLGSITKANISPYSSSIFAKNVMFIDAEKLLEDRYANILDKNVLEEYSMPENKSGTNYTYSKFYEAFENYNELMNIAFSNFKTKLKNDDTKALALNKEFTEFKEKNNPRLLKEGIFTVLRDKYGTNDFEVWENPVDRDLFILLDKKDPEAINRYKDIMRRSSKKVEKYCFEQFLADKQIKENKEFRQNIVKNLDYAPKPMVEKGFVHVNDMLVGGSKMDLYVNSKVFIPNYRIGCPDGGTHGIQMWGAPVLHPAKMFNPDGTLGPSGEFLKAKLEAMLDACENVRIDHAIGLVDPYLYDKTTIEFSNGKLVRHKLREGRISDLGIDPDGNFKKILEKIIIPTMREHGLDPQDAVWEDLGNQSQTFKDIYINKLHLPGISQLEWEKASNCPPNNTALVGSHDSVPAKRMVEDNLNAYNRDDSSWNPLYLAGFLHWDPKRSDERDEMCKKISSNPMERVKAKFANMFMNCKQIQISFADFFGINEVYNYGGKNIASNWKLRMSKDYEDQYYKNLSSGNPTAINLPEVLGMAVKAQMDKEYIQYLNKKKDEIKDLRHNEQRYNELLELVNKEAEEYKQNLKAKKQPLLDRLNKFAEILKEKED